MKQEVTVVLLAGGESTRFWPLKEKTLVRFLGESLIARHLQQLAALNFTHVVIVANKTNEPLLKKTSLPGQLHVSFVQQEGIGQGQAVMALAKASINGPVFIMNASDWYADDFLHSYQEHMRMHAEYGLLGAVRVTTYFPGGYITMSPEGDIKEIIEKPAKGAEPSDVVRVVADYFPDVKQLLSQVSHFASDVASGYELGINALIQQGLRCHAEITKEENWNYLKYPWNVLSMKDAFLGGLTGQSIDASAIIKENVSIEGPVIIEAGVKIFEGTKIVGPCFIGQDTIIGNNNIIRASVIGKRCVTGFNTDITRSYIGENCWFHSNYIGDSVLDDDVSMGSGTVVANLRLDEKNIATTVKKERIDSKRNKLGTMIGSHVRIGVNVSIMPGIKIGSNTYIGAGVVLDQDLENSSFCMMKKGSYSVVSNRETIAGSREQFRKAI